MIKEENKNNQSKINLRKKVTFDEMRGSIKLNEKTNAVELEKELYK